MPGGSIVNKRNNSDLSVRCPEIILKGKRNILSGKGFLNIQIELGDGILSFTDIRDLKTAILFQKSKGFFGFSDMIKSRNIIVFQLSGLLVFPVKALIPADDPIPVFTVEKKLQGILQIGKVFMFQFQSFMDPLDGLRVMAGKNGSGSQCMRCPGTLL